MRDLHALDLYLEHQATWHTQRAVASESEFVTKFHGGLLTAVPFLAAMSLERLDSGQILIAAAAFACAASALLSLVTYNQLQGVQGLRMLQYHMDASLNFSRAALAGGGASGTYFAPNLQHRRIQPLAEQLDPVGISVQSVRRFLIIDIFLAVATATWLLGSAVPTVTPWWGQLGAAIALGWTSSWGLLRWHVDPKVIEASEARTEREINHRLTDLGSAPQSA
jgi:hypothetical protein